MDWFVIGVCDLMWFFSLLEIVENCFCIGVGIWFELMGGELWCDDNYLYGEWYFVVKKFGENYECDLFCVRLMCKIFYW